jgi:hypothetical protein
MGLRATGFKGRIPLGGTWGEGKGEPDDVADSTDERKEPSGGPDPSF